jgi:hypothetical protein
MAAVKIAFSSLSAASGGHTSGMALARLRGFEGYDEAKPLILRGEDPKGRHYTGVVDATCVAVIFGGACGGRASLSFSNRSCSSGSGWV